MADRKDVLMTQAVSAFAKGYGTDELPDGVSGWFYDRYYKWIDTPKNNPRAGGRRPADVWEANRADFLDRFRTIGKEAATLGGTVDEKTLEDRVSTLERSFDCPWCPVQD